MEITFTSNILRDESDLQHLLTFSKLLPHDSNLDNFEEQIQLSAIRASGQFPH